MFKPSNCTAAINYFQFNIDLFHFQLAGVQQPSFFRYKGPYYIE